MTVVIMCRLFFFIEYLHVHLFLLESLVVLIVFINVLQLNLTVIVTIDASKATVSMGIDWNKVVMEKLSILRRLLWWTELLIFRFFGIRLGNTPPNTMETTTRVNGPWLSSF